VGRPLGWICWGLAPPPPHGGLKVPLPLISRAPFPTVGTGFVAQLAQGFDAELYASFLRMIVRKVLTHNCAQILEGNFGKGHPIT
jgi:hypothetical protein